MGLTGIIKDSWILVQLNTMSTKEVKAFTVTGITSPAKVMLDAMTAWENLPDITNLSDDKSCWDRMRHDDHPHNTKQTPTITILMNAPPIKDLSS